MKKILKAIGGFFQKVFAGQFHWLKKNSHLSVSITERLKQLVENPSLNILATIIPGNIDDKVLYQLQKLVPKVAEQIAIAHGIIQASESNTNMVAAITEYLKGKVKDDRAAFWVEFSARLNVALSDGKLTFGEGVLLAQMVYLENKGAGK